MKQPAALFVFGLAAALAHTTTHALTTTWTGAADTDWNASGNWDNSVPAYGTDAVFTNAVPLLTSSSPEIAAERLIMMNTGAVTFDLGAGATLGVQDSLLIGTNGTARLTLASGAISTPGSLRLGCNASSSNALDILDGARVDCGALDVGLSLGSIGFPSYNTLTVRNGGVLSVSGATRIAMRVSGDGNSLYNNEIRVLPGGLFLAAGMTINTTAANLNNCGVYADGGVVTNNGTLLIGYNRGSNSRISVSNNGYFRNNGAIGLSPGSGPNYINVVSGGVLDVNGNLAIASPGMYLGHDFPGTWGDNAAPDNIVTVSNATLLVSKCIETGYKNKGRNNTFILHEDPGETARITVTGPIRLGLVSGDNKLIVNGGTLTATAINTAVESDQSTSTNNQIRISGRNTSIQVGSMNLRNKAVLAFTIPDDGFANTPLVLSGNAVISADSHIEINAGKFQGTSTLLTTTGVLSGATPDNIAVNAAPGIQHKVTVEPSLLKIHMWHNRSLFFLK